MSNFKNNYFEEHRTAAFELTFWKDCLELFFWVSCKVDEGKYQVNGQLCSAIELETKFGVYALYIFNPYAFLWA